VVQGADEERDGVGNAVKISKITTPTLIIHAQEDMLIPVGQGLEAVSKYVVISCHFFRIDKIMLE
jgi:pimeloyl-ACP methyl ester carboxylesterase